MEHWKQVYVFDKSDFFLFNLNDFHAEQRAPGKTR